MVTANLEQTIIVMQEEIKNNRHEIERLQAVVEIQNLMSKYEYLHTAAMHAETAELFARKAPGIKAEIGDWGIYEGYEGVRRLYADFHPYVEGDRTGNMFMHTLTTPIIQVAKDCKTAKALWISPGHETKQAKAHWAWCKYRCDFVKEDGEWKIWHLHVIGIFQVPWDKCWTEGVEMRVPADLSDEYKPDGPTSYRWEYSPTGTTENVPVPPEPYETWDE